jgi:hypothetical protein
VVPVSNNVIHVTDKNRVMGEVEQVRLLGSDRHFALECVSGLQKRPFDAAANTAEPGEKRREEDEDNIGRKIRTSNVEAVQGLSEEVVEG